jgi:SAM-dependent methyltransferase
VSLKSLVPWRMKLAAKIALSRLPVPYRFWRALSCFDLGPMEKPEYAYAVFREHYARAALSRRGNEFVCLELGPGNTLFTAVIARAFGASKTYLVDEGAFADESPRPYFRMAEYLDRAGLPAPSLEGCAALDEILARSGAEYCTRGLASLAEIPTGSVDFLFSHAVLEHVRRRDFFETMKEMRRVLHPRGIASHRVDFRDHLNGRLDSLRFSARRWESKLFAESGFYTNRLRYSEIVDACTRAGMTVEPARVERWPELPTPREKLAPPFRDVPESDLQIFACDLLLRPAGA